MYGATFYGRHSPRQKAKYAHFWKSYLVIAYFDDWFQTQADQDLRFISSWETP
jgi:hypothetical protein